MKITEKQRDKIIDGLKVALQLFGPRGCRWIQGNWVRHVDGVNVGEMTAAHHVLEVHRIVKKFGAQACAFCLDGALMAAASTKRQYFILVAVVEKYGPTIGRQLVHPSVVAFNDCRERSFKEIRDELNGAVVAFGNETFPVDVPVGELD